MTYQVFELQPNGDSAIVEHCGKLYIVTGGDDLPIMQCLWYGEAGSPKEAVKQAVEEAWPV